MRTGGSTVLAVSVTLHAPRMHTHTHTHSQRHTHGTSANDVCEKRGLEVEMPALM